MSFPRIPGLDTLLPTPTVAAPQSAAAEVDKNAHPESLMTTSPPAHANAHMNEASASSGALPNMTPGELEVEKPQEADDEMMVDESPKAATTASTDAIVSPDAADRESEVEKAREVDDEPMVDQPSNATSSSSTDAVVQSGAPPSPPSLTSGLEALLGGLDPTPETEVPAAASSHQTGEALGASRNNGEGENPEWEEDSSPYESSSESTSSEDSDDDSEDEKDYKILGPEETARLLMEMDGGSDDDGEGTRRGAGSAQVRTKNEVSEDIIPRPDVEIKPEMEVVELGTIEHIVGNTTVIKANTSGEYQVLDTGSVLCLQDRTVIAAVADVIAAVREPRYTAGFASEDEMKTFGLAIGTKIYYPPAFAKLGLTQTLRSEKGTDASNFYDEEVGDDEMEFSDDEKEAEYKRQLKAKKRGARGGRDGTSNGRKWNTDTSVASGTGGLQYDDDDEDGPYRPLARPAGFGQGQAPSSGAEQSGGFSSHGGAYRGGRGDNRGRGMRGRGGRGNRGNRGGHSLPPRPQGGQTAQPPLAQSFNPHLPAPPPPATGQSYPAIPFQPNTQQQQQQQQHQFPFPWPPNPQAPFVPPPPPQFANAPGAGGMYFNPNFFAALQNQVQEHQQQQQNNQWQRDHSQQNNQWPGQGGHR